MSWLANLSQVAFLEQQKTSEAKKLQRQSEVTKGDVKERKGDILLSGIAGSDQRKILNP